jgi:hypothetical protein
LPKENPNVQFSRYNLLNEDKAGARPEDRKLKMNSFLIKSPPGRGYIETMLFSEMIF